MKTKTLAFLFAFTFALGLALPSARADHDKMDGYCPMMTMKHSKDLGLSKKQETKIKEIKDRMWEQLKPIAQESSAEVEEVLNAKQKAKYKELMASHGSCGKGDCGCDSCGKKDGDSCEMKEKKN